MTAPFVPISEDRLKQFENSICCGGAIPGFYHDELRELVAGYRRAEAAEALAEAAGKTTMAWRGDASMNVFHKCMRHLENALAAYREGSNE